MIKYILAGNVPDEAYHHRFENIRELSEQEVKQFYESEAALVPFDKTYSLFEMCEQNYRAIENYCQELSLLTGGNQLTWHMVIIKWNTLTLNFLASFRVFIDHHETTLDKGYDQVNSIYTLFKEITAFHYDTYFSYRFLWHLRNYILHCGLPACSWDFSEIKEDPDKGKTQVDIIYDKEGTLKGFDWKKLEAEIESQPAKIKTVSLIRELHSSITDIARFTANLHIKRLEKSFNFWLIS